MKNFFIFIFIFLILTMPAFSLAQEQGGRAGLVPCDNTPSADGTTISKPCDFSALLNLVNIVIKFIFLYMAVPIAAIMFVYAGILLVTAGEEAAGARTKAKSIFTNALLGLVLAAACWLIVRTFLAILGYEGDWIGFPKI